MEQEEKIKDQEQENDIEADTDTAESGEKAATEDKPEQEVARGSESEVTFSEEEQGEQAQPTEENSQAVEQNSQPTEGNSQIVERNSQPTERMLTQSQVNELVGRARQEGREAGRKEVMDELYGRYGVSTDNEMNDIFGKGQGYDLLNDDYNTLNGKFSDLSAENALLKSKIVDNRWDDVKAILKSKGMDISVENIAQELATHPEWCGDINTQEDNQGSEFTPEMGDEILERTKMKVPNSTDSRTQTGTIRKLGSNIPDSKENLEEADINRLFGM